ncbi:deoxyribodipyrimidine photo-lyase [Neiella marina]|uniref:Deoxyribodipyrimidine photo-lyase n=1 Tax=Neiella holothuriorum TaxID=2870530 RepID=A0ABS7EHV7_9GAMM|nr:deoxyribodipyrimidine photo-lyase [Neiella holothuriorum]MBW8191931.1 deoxyribodipyrimidine photo-lyase [Neiella holothuriorum]
MTTKTFKRALVWFRRDLRVLDNPALSQACELSKSVVAVFVVSPVQWQKHHKSAIQIDFTRRRLLALKSELSELNIDLKVLIADDFNQQLDCVLDCVESWQIDAVFSNREYEVDEVNRDQQFLKLLRQTPAKPACYSYEERCIIPPGQIVNGSHAPYKVFTPFSKNWLKQLATMGWHCLAKPNKLAIHSNTFASAAELAEHWHCSLAAEDWPAAEGLSKDYAVATPDILAQLRTFAREQSQDYQQQRDFPALDNTSKLSPHLAIGSLSAKQCLARLCHEHGAPWELAEGPKTWLNELIWREFYCHVMVAWPHVCMNQAFNPRYQQIQWPNDSLLFDKWCQGKTGFPLVDAAMRQLNQTGWMHNRLRMIVASFLSKDLMIDWRWGEQYFMSRLIDGDLSANNGGWQWAASTGTDAAPYFRIFNPETQSKRFDGSGLFIRRFIPELADCPTALLHKAGAGGHYIAPIVDHGERRQMSLALYKDHHEQLAQAG